MEGWFKVHRKIIDSVVFQNPNLFKVWLYCLARANHKENAILFESKKIIIKAGQFITGRFEGAKDCKMNPSTFRNQLNRLRIIGNLDIKSDNKKSIITIVNWELYQNSNKTLDNSLDNKRTTRGQQEDTDKNVKNGNNVNNKKEQKGNFTIENLPLDMNGELFIKTKYFFVTKTLIQELKQKYNISLSDESLKIEFNKMELWLDENGSKKKYKSFFVNWLSKTNKNQNQFGENKNGTNKPDSKGSVKSRLDYKPDFESWEKRIEELKLITGES